MKTFYEQAIPSMGFLIWILFTFFFVRAVVQQLKKRADQTGRPFEVILASVSGVPLSLFLLLLIKFLFFYILS